MFHDVVRPDGSSGPVRPLADVLLIEDLHQQRLPARRLAAVLQRAGWRAQLIHFGADTDPGEIIACARDARPRLIVFSILFADRLSDNLSLASTLRRTGIQAHITIAGPLPAFAYAELLDGCPALDSVLCCEAEAIIAPLAASALDPQQWQAVDGMAYRSPSPYANALPQAAISLEDLPFPAHDAVIPFCSGYGFATIESSRGCYHACTFCLPCAFYRKQRACYRLRSIPNLVDEIEQLYGRGTRLFLFDDEQFLPPSRLRVERVAELGGELERRGLRIAFTIKCRADDVEVALFERLKEMGLIRVYIGIESGCQASLDLLGKGVTADRNAEALAILDDLGIVADFRTLTFHPWSTQETITQDISFLETVMPCLSTCFTFSEVEIYPGTELAARLIEEGRAEENRCLPGYTIQDPGAETLRRLSRLVYSPGAIYPRLQASITQAWFDLLLRQRFESGQFDATRMRRLKTIAARVNRTSLDVWRDMLAFAREGDLSAADRVNDLAEVCVSRINTACILNMETF